MVLLSGQTNRGTSEPDKSSAKFDPLAPAPPTYDLGRVGHVVKAAEYPDLSYVPEEDRRCHKRDGSLVDVVAMSAALIDGGAEVGVGSVVTAPMTVTEVENEHEHAHEHGHEHAHEQDLLEQMQELEGTAPMGEAAAVATSGDVL